MDDRMKQFLAAEAFGVVGASGDRDKFGNKVLRCYLSTAKRRFPFTPGRTRSKELRR